MGARRGKIPFWGRWGAGACCWAGLLGTLERYDLSLSAAVVSYESSLGRIISRYGEWPSWVLILACVVIFARTREPDAPWRQYRPLAIAVMLTALICPLLITQALKFFWGRVRYYHLGPDGSGFTPFYRPGGVGVGASFPSGHVAMAFTSAPAAFFFLAQSPAAGAVATLLVLLYGGVVGWGRIRYGRHYLSDVLFSAGMLLLVAPILVRWQRRREDEAASQGGTPGAELQPTEGGT